MPDLLLDGIPLVASGFVDGTPSDLKVLQPLSERFAENLLVGSHQRPVLELLYGHDSGSELLCDFLTELAGVGDGVGGCKLCDLLLVDVDRDVEVGLAVSYLFVRGYSYVHGNEVYTFSKIK